MSTAIDTDRLSSVLRARGIDPATRKLLITILDGSEQEKDLSEPTNCEGLGRVRHFRAATAEGWPENPLPLAPAARALGIAPAPTELRAQVFQNAICNWRCWYCYVDFPLLSGNLDHSKMRSAGELVDLFLAEANRPSVIDLSGGQPDLVPEWVAWTLQELEHRGLRDSVYLWSDDNLSNDYFFQLVGREERKQIDDACNYGKVCCFKGFDDASFAFNTAAEPGLFKRQFELMARLIRETRIDLYCYATFTTPDDRDIPGRMSAFIDRLQDIHPSLPLRVVPLQIAAFAPSRPRMAASHERAMTIQEQAIAGWQAELARRFHPSERKKSICDVEIRDR